MTTTPTLWGSEVTFSFDFFAFGTHVAALADGTFIISWQNLDGDLFARQLNELGSFLGGNFLSDLSDATTRPLNSPFVFQQTDGRVVVNYGELTGTSPVDNDVRWHSPATDFLPHPSSFGTELSPFDEVLLDSVAGKEGGAAILYNYTGPGDITSLVLRFTDAIGNQASNQIFIDPSDARIEQNPDMAALHTGFMAVAYESVLSGSATRDVRLRVYTPGELDVSGEVIVSAGDVLAGFPDIIQLRGGSYVIVWQQDGGIGMRRFFGNSTPLDASPIVVPNTVGALLPKVAALMDGGFLIAWTAIDGTEGDGSPELDIFLQRFGQDGVSIGDIVHIDKLGDQGFGSLAGIGLETLSDGRVILTYESETGDATGLTSLNYSIYDPREQTIFGTSENDNFVSREDGATIFGFLGEDKLQGRAAADTLDGGDGNDTLIGNEGDDVLVGGPGGDLLSAGAGSDTADWSAATGNIVFALSASGAGTTANVAGIGQDTVDQIENIITGSGNDRLIGNARANTFDGGDGNDRLSGNNGPDTLIGGNGNDTLDGGTNPATQGDIMIGGPGDDTYIADSPLDLIDEGMVFPAFGFGGTDSIQSTTDFFWDLYSIAERVVISEDVVDPEGDGTTGVGSVFDNELIGNSKTNVLFGRGGSDTYRAGDGVDFISLSTLGLTDGNAYVGVDGVNTVIVEERSSGPFSYDIVFEFESGKDKLDVSDYGFASAAAVLATGVDDGFGSSYFILGDGLDYLYMAGLEKADIAAGDFIV